MLSRVRQQDLGTAALIRIEDAARALARALWVVEHEYPREVPVTLPDIVDLRVGLLTAMTKFRSPKPDRLRFFAEGLMLLEVFREAEKWALAIHPGDVLDELETVRNRIAPPDALIVRSDVERFHELLEDVLEKHRL